MSGTLYVVATPIGNLEDITLRALKVLGAVAAIACEDTRHTRVLLQHHGLDVPLLSYHEHNEIERTPELVARLLAGEDLALVSDAGTPTLSDPGYRVVRAAADAGVRVVPIPGANAALACLSASGLATDRFLFVGFLPKRGRERVLAELRTIEATLVFYVPARDLDETLAELAVALGDRPAAVGRELTKLHEELRRGRLRELGAFDPRGEATVLVAGAASEPAREPATEAEVRAALAEALSEGLTRREASKKVAKGTGWNPRDVYKL